MCGFLLTYSQQPIGNEAVEKATRALRNRGPDHTRVNRWVLANGTHLLVAHYLLDVSGQQAEQPVIIANTRGKPEFTLLFNGEIFNYRDLVPEANTDTQALSVLLRRHRSLPFDKLDGEYAIITIDHATLTVTIATDQFMTKPVCLGWSLNRSMFAVSSYMSALSILGDHQAAYATPNSSSNHTLTQPATWWLPDETPAPTTETYRYDLDQGTNEYIHWEGAFLEAVRKRATHGTLPAFIPLSSGYDSGALCAAMNILRLPYRTITIDSDEQGSIIAQRHAINASSAGSCQEHVQLPPLAATERARIRRAIEERCEPYTYNHSGTLMQDDDGAIGAYRVAEVAKERGWVVCLSGCGADEIVSDYGFNGVKHYEHSQFGGLFPQKLDSLFPWRKFYGDTMRSYLFKDEFIFGSHGIEGRYPFLDVQLTQQFLSLTSELKNREYKAPIAQFMRNVNYPFEEGVKRGFSPGGKLVPIPGVRRIKSLWQRVVGTTGDVVR